MPRKIGELELDFENLTWNSNWDFEERTVDFTVKIIANFVIYHLKTTKIICTSKPIQNYPKIP